MKLLRKTQYEYKLNFIKNAKVLFFPIVYLIRLFYKSKLKKCMAFHKEGLCEYLCKGTNIDKKLMQKVINRIKRDYGFNSNSIAAEEVYQIKKLSFEIAKYASKNKMSVAVAYHIIMNNTSLYNKLIA